jgi:acetoacetyl-CoA reductase
MPLLDGRTALVTGASRGIGAAIAQELALHGAAVVVNYREDRSGADAVVSTIEQTGGVAASIGCDVSDRDAVAAMGAEIAARFQSLDILINNAGILRDKRFVKMLPQDWHDVMDVNLQGVINATAMALPGMLDRGYGRIVSVASFVAQAGNFGQTNYATAKAGIIGFTRALALEVARDNVTVNAVCPGFIATAMWDSIPDPIREKLLERIPMRRAGQPSEVATLIRFLVAEGTYVTGQTLNVNGGIFIG